MCFPTHPSQSLWALCNMAVRPKQHRHVPSNLWGNSVSVCPLAANFHPLLMHFWPPIICALSCMKLLKAICCICYLASWSRVFWVFFLCEQMKINKRLGCYRMLCPGCKNCCSFDFFFLSANFFSLKSHLATNIDRLRILSLTCQCVSVLKR